MTTGEVVWIEIHRDFGKVGIRSEVQLVIDGSKATFPIDFWFAIYRDDGIDMIDPTEMVKRNWMISLLQRALSEKLPVTIEHWPESEMVLTVRVERSDAS